MHCVYIWLSMYATCKCIYVYNYWKNLGNLCIWRTESPFLMTCLLNPFLVNQWLCHSLGKSLTLSILNYMQVNQANKMATHSGGFPWGFLEPCMDSMVPLPGLGVPTGALASAQKPWPFPERPKPPATMIELSALAIYKSPGKRAGLRDIAEFIIKWVPYYAQDSKWQNSLRVILGKHVGTILVKLPKTTSHPQAFTLTDAYAEEIVSKLPDLKRRLSIHLSPDFPWWCHSTVREPRNLQISL